jgi:hypothetical protein
LKHGFKELAEFYRVAQSIVRGYPAQYAAVGEPEMVALRPNSFVVARSLQDFNAENVAKRPHFSDSPYFYSRNFTNAQHRSGENKIEYPIVGFAEDRVTLNLTRSDSAHLNFFVIDQIPQGANGFYEDGYSSAREVEDVARDIRDHFRKFISVLRRFGYYENLFQLPNGWYDEFSLIESGVSRYPCPISKLDSLVNFDNLTVEIFPTMADNCLIGVANIHVKLDYCPEMPMRIDYAMNDETKFTDDVNCN